ncbi:MAG: hypothetical protein HOP36_17500 [Methyloglobulus sp.]|nr:hypothetical protein [Methyloglobulus sp.]
MNIYEEPRLKYADKFGETISFQNLIQRWSANKKLIDELCFSKIPDKKLRPYRDKKEGVIHRLEGKEVIVFLPQPSRDERCIIEGLNDCQRFITLPEDTYFYWADVLSFEESNPEIIRGKKWQTIDCPSQKQGDEDGWIALPERGFFGDPILETESLPFYQAYRMLENRLANLSYVEFGLFVFDDDIRIFETKPDEKGYLPRLSGAGMLIQVGIAEANSKESTPLESTLSRFRYAKADIEQLTPQYGYVPFDSACKEIAAFAGKDEKEIKLFLINLASYKNICPHHPYCGFAQPEHEHLWPQSAYPGNEVDNILRGEFGIDEYDIALDVEFYVRELKTKGDSEAEIKRIRNILDRRVHRNMDLLVRQNAIAEIAALRPSAYSEHYKRSSDLLENLETMPERPDFEKRVKRFVWLNILDKRKTEIEADKPSDARPIELGQLNKTIAEIKRQLGCLEVGQEVRESVSKPQAESEENDSVVSQSCKEMQTESVHLKRDVDSNINEKLADLFDAVTVENLAKMFPTNRAEAETTAKWKRWQNNAKENGLNEARQGRGKFNPYKAGVWFLNRKIQGWDTARVYRTLANNLPARSLDEKYLLKGEID